MRLSSLVTALLATAATASANWFDDFVVSLPGYGPTRTPHFSGYLDASAGCDMAVNGPECKLHYWLASAETDPSKAPVVLWLNGGPGSTSLIGFLQEQGPLLINATGGLMENPWSWTKYVNLIALESPMGVGYSYCSRQRTGKPCVNTDRYTASASRAAMVDFFTKFPDLAKNPFYITGESYAGIYIPTLAKEILDNTDINLKGIGVGDPCTDNTAQADSMDSLWYGHKYGLVDEEVFDMLWNQCEVRLPSLMRKGGVHRLAHQLNDELKQIQNMDDRKARAKELYEDVVFNGVHEKIQDKPECLLAFRKFMFSSSHSLSQSWKDMYIDDYNLFGPISFLEDEYMQTYMNREDVRKALHVEDAPTTTWPSADVGFDYTSEYDACNDEVVLNISMVDIYKEIAPQIQRTWIYNGDADPCVSYEGTRLAVKQIGFLEMDGGGYRPWFYNQTAASMDLLKEKSPLFGPNLVAQNMGAQFGGEVVDYYHGLSFVTVHGSGHMVPQFRPQAALTFLKTLVQGNMLSPLFPNNATLTELSNSEFRDALNEWTEEAKGPPYVDHVAPADLVLAQN